MNSEYSNYFVTGVNPKSGEVSIVFLNESVGYSFPDLAMENGAVQGRVPKSELTMKQICTIVMTANNAKMLIDAIGNGIKKLEDEQQ